MDGTSKPAANHTQTARSLYAVIENGWELTKVLLRASERHVRRDYRGAVMSLGHAQGLLGRMSAKIDRVRSSLDEPPSERAREFDA